MSVLGIPIVSDSNSIAAELALLDSSGDVTRIFMVPLSPICIVFSLDIGCTITFSFKAFVFLLPKGDLSD
jgi:hypothetical protein